MKQRLHNTFIRIFKNNTIARILATIGYVGLFLAYCLVRLFLKNESKVDINQARNNLEKLSAKPSMSYKISSKKTTKELSIIVPAYNAEETIRCCIESVVNQNTEVDFELIVVNDGSSDKTRSIVESIDDEHLILTNQKNRGFSGARNRGIDESHGKYIMFLDSDDMLIDNCIESMMRQIKDGNADIIQGSFYSFDKDYRKMTILRKNVITDDDKVFAPGYPWAKIYKKEVFENIRFPLDVWFEDTIVCMLIYRLCSKMIVTDEVVYAWRLNPNGITKNARKNKKCIDHYWVMEHTLEKAKELGLPNDKVQYELVKGHLSTLMYRRLSLQDEEVIESAFVLGCEMLDSIRPKGYKCKCNILEKDLEKAFVTRNYKLWKLASFVV